MTMWTQIRSAPKQPKRFGHIGIKRGANFVALAESFRLKFKK